MSLAPSLKRESLVSHRPRLWTRFHRIPRGRAPRIWRTDQPVLAFLPFVILPAGASTIYYNLTSATMEGVAYYLALVKEEERAQEIIMKKAEADRRAQRDRSRSRSPRRPYREERDRSRSPSGERERYRRRDRSPVNGNASRAGYDRNQAPPPPRSYEERSQNKEQMMSNLRESSQQDRRTYVGNLAYDVKWHDLKDFMRKGF